MIEARGMGSKVPAYLLTVILAGALALALNVRPVRASETIYIRADGSIDPPTAPIITYDHLTYALTDNITSSGDGIVVERDSCVLDGASYAIQGSDPGSSRGISMSHTNSNTVKRFEIRGFNTGLWLEEASGCHVRENRIIDNAGGIELFNSTNNDIYGNHFARNQYDLVLSYADGNVVAGNNITASWIYGLTLYNSSSNLIYHNNLIDNPVDIGCYYSVNTWDDGYPSGGNYWSDSTDVDVYCGEHQNETGSDGVWDHPYVIDLGSQDRYPLTSPYGGPAGDVDSDRDVDIFDIIRMASVYSVRYPDPHYDRLCDLDLDGDIDLFDVVQAAIHYGTSW